MPDQGPPPDWEQLSELPEIDLPELNRERATEDDFMADLIHAANNVRRYLALVACVVPVRPPQQVIRAVLMGHMVRIFKLYDTLAYLLVERRTEVAWIVTRALVDTIINLRYLLRHPLRCQRYVRESLAYEKKLMEEIERRLHQPPLPIESRMLRSIAATFDRAGVNPSEVESGEWRGLSSERKAREVGLEALYEFGFRVASHNVHGTWHDLEHYHLRLVDGSYRPGIRFRNPRPQIMGFPTVASLDAAAAYLSFAVGDDAREVTGRVELLRDWVQELSALHEEWLIAQSTKGS